MKKNTPQKQTVADFVQLIDSDINKREAELFALKSELESMRDVVAADRVSVEEGKTLLEQKKAEFAVLRSEVDHKFAKIRQDEELTNDLRAQASERKALEQLANKAEEDRLLTELNLVELQKRELALSKREEKYKEEVERKFASNLFKGQ